VEGGRLAKTKQKETEKRRGGINKNKDGKTRWESQTNTDRKN
jgi:hypothetical protein